MKKSFHNIACSILLIVVLLQSGYSQSYGTELTDYSIPQTFTFEKLVPLQWHSVIFDHDIVDSNSFSFFNKNEITNSYLNAGILYFIPKSTTVSFDHPGYDPLINKPRRNILSVNPPIQKTSSLAPLTVEDNIDPQELVDFNLLGDFCLNAENVSTQGDPTGIGTFASGLASIGFEEGVIMASGNIANAIGPNNTASSSSINSSTGSDPDLVAIAGNGVNDVAIIEFDFTPDNDTIQFTYVFASEEYCEYVDAGFNDAFGFFLSGPGISGPYSNGAINIATLPDGTTPVSIDNVNWTNNQAYYIDNTLSNMDGCAPGEANNPPFAPDDIQYDGFTIPLLAIAEVVPCEVYHIKLAVGDAGDSAYDSAVFIGGSSFISGGNQASIEYEANYENDEDIATEGCTGAYLAFQKYGNIDVEVTFDIIVLPESTAIPGLDYEQLPTSYTLGPGIEFDTLWLDIFTDAIFEGEENIVIELTGICDCLSPIIEILIQDPPELEIFTNNIDICDEGTVNIGVEVIGGVEDYSYEWNNGETGSNFDLFHDGDEYYSVTVTDMCGQEQQATIDVFIFPSYFQEVDTSICQGEVIFINGIPVATGGLYEQYLTSSHGCDSTVFVDLTVQPLPSHDSIYYRCAEECIEFEGVIYCEEGTHSFVSNIPGSNGCDSIVVFDLEWLDPLVSTVEPDVFNCVNDSVLLTGIDVYGGDGISYYWDGPNGFLSKEIETWVHEPGIYSFYTIQEIEDITCVSNVFVTEVEQDTLTPQLFPLQDQVISCGVDEVNLIAISTGGEPENLLDYTWLLPDGSLFNGNNLMTSDSGTYYITLLNMDNQCSTTDSVHVSIQDVLPEIIVNEISFGCNTIQGQLFSNVNIPGGTYQWIGPNGYNSTDANPIVFETGQYEVEYVINNICIANSIVEVLEDFEPPNIDTYAGVISCLNSTTELGFTADEYESNQWDGPSGFTSNSNNITVNTTGIYTLTVVGENGCETIELVTVEDITYQVPLETEDKTINCLHDSLQLEVMGSGLVSYQWDGPNSFYSDDPSPFIQDAGTYSVIVTDSSGCTGEAMTQVIPDLNAPEFDHNQISLNCYNQIQTIEIDPLTDIDNYEWSGPNGFNSNEMIVEISEPGIYLVTATGINGCMETKEILIEGDYSLPEFQVYGDTLNCLLGTADLTASLDPTNTEIIWTDESFNFVSNELTEQTDQGGIYYGIATNLITGCQDTLDTEILLDDNSPDIIATGDTLNCLSTSTTISASSSNADEFVWEGPNGYSSTLPANEVDFPGIYHITVTAPNGCTNTETVEILVDLDEPEIIAEDQIINCNFPSVDVNVEATGINNSFLWTGPNGFTDTNPSLIGIENSGTYTVAVTSQNGCSNSLEIEIIEDLEEPSLDISNSNDIDCNSLTSSLYFTTNNPNENTIYWTGPNGFESTEEIITVNEGGFYIGEIQGPNGCYHTDSIEVLVDADTITIQAINGLINCYEPTTNIDIMYSSNDIEQINWSGPNGFVSNGLTPEVDVSGNYNVIVTAHNGCTSVASIQIEENFVMPFGELAGSDINCFNPEIDIILTVDQPEVYEISWTTPFGEVSNQELITTNQEGIYYVDILDPSNGCSVIDSILINEIPAVQDFELIQNSPACVLNSGQIEFINVQGGVGPFQYSIDGANTYQGSPIFEGLVAGEYQAVIVDATGCIVEDTTQLIQIETYEIYHDSEIDISLGDDYQFNLTTNIPDGQIDEILWVPATGLSCTDCLNPTTNPTETITYTVIVTDKNGCQISEDITLRVRFKGIYIPNIFSPNDDTQNDYFEVFADLKSVEEILEFRIFDRWGNRVFESGPAEPGNEILRWDGNFKNENAQSGVYVYTVRYRLVNGEIRFQHGDVTLIR